MNNPIKNFGDIFKKTGSEIFEFILHYVGGRAVDKVVDGTVDTVISKPLESNLWGAGTDDEALAINALVLAALELGADQNGLDRVMQVFASLPLSKRRRLITIIGKRGFDSIITLPATAGVNRPSKPLKTTSNINIDGAYFILYLSNKKTGQIRKILEGMKLTDTPADSIAETYETFVSAIAKVEADTKIIGTVDDIAKNFLKELKNPGKKKSWFRQKFYKH